MKSIRPVTDGFKFVEQRFARNFASGAVRIGSLSSFAKIEGARGDATEQMFISTVSYLDVKTEEDSARAAAVGIGMGPGGGMIANCTKIEFASDAYCLCFSLSDSNNVFEGEGAGAIFRISDIRGFARRISQENPDRLRNDFTVGVVQYTGRAIDLAKDPIPGHKAFIKNEEYAHEREVRILWESTSAAPRLEPFVTKASFAMASFITRLR